LVSAYAPFANDGIAVVPYIVERVRGGDGRLLYQRTPQSLGRVVDAQYIAMMNGMMQETLRTGTARRAAVPGWAAAGKTGTSQDFRDAWFIGYTAHLLTGIWLGNDDNSPTRRVTGSGIPVDIWNRVMRAAHGRIPVAGLPGSRGSTSAIPVPPENVPAPVAPVTARPPSREGASLDGWLMDRLFGRR
jgi:penicillin-binding protein 1A